MQAQRDQNFVPTLLGISNVDGVTPVTIYADPITHRLLVDNANASNTQVYNEIVAGSDTTWTLADTPIAGTVRVYVNGQRLTVGVDYTIAGSVITTTLFWSAGSMVADYEK